MRATILAAMCAACYDPSAQECAYQCATDEARSCPSGLTCNPQNLCASSAEQMCATDATNATDAFDCMGWPYCPSNFMPSQLTAAGGTFTVAANASSNLDTDTGVATNITTPPSSVDDGVRVFHVTSLDIGVNAVLKVTGSKPVRFIVEDTATIAGTLDVSAHQDSTNAPYLPGPGGDAASCDASSGGPGRYAGGGGAGGGFGTVGGDGGVSGAPPNIRGAGGTRGVTRGNPNLVPLLGGCGGGNGDKGEPASTNLMARGGGGGGAVQISSRGKLLVTSSGKVVASGGGGEGALDFNMVNPGGGGGGSGGAILLEATTLELAADAHLCANGGGGGGAGKSGFNGGAGAPGRCSESPALGGSGPIGGGVGGARNGNAAQGTPGAQLTATQGTGGGGGGGGVGRIHIKGHVSEMIDPTAMVSPAPL